MAIQKIKKVLAFLPRMGHILSNIPATPLSLRANAHFGRVFSFMRHFYGRLVCEVSLATK